jgi:hypothetical protein
MASASEPARLMALLRAAASSVTMVLLRSVA